MISKALTTIVGNFLIAYIKNWPIHEGINSRVWKRLGREEKVVIREMGKRDGIEISKYHAKYIDWLEA